MAGKYRLPIWEQAQKRLTTPSSATAERGALADATRDEYLRFVRKLAARHGDGPAGLDEPAVRAHLLRLKDEHHYSPSSMRTAVPAMRAYYGLHLGRDWKLFNLVRSPSAQKLPTVLTRAEVARLFATVREPRFRTLFRLIHACSVGNWASSACCTDGAGSSSIIRMCTTSCPAAD